MKRESYIDYNITMTTINNIIHYFGLLIGLACIYNSEPYETQLHHNTPLLILNDNQYIINDILNPFIISLLGQFIILYKLFAIDNNYLTLLSSFMFMERSYHYQSEISGSLGCIMFLYSFSNILTTFITYFGCKLNNNQLLNYMYRIISIIMIHGYIYLNFKNVQSKYINPYLTGIYMITLSFYYINNLEMTSLKSNDYVNSYVINNILMLLTFADISAISIIPELNNSWLETDISPYFKMNDMLIITIIFGNLYISQKLDEIVNKLFINHKIYAKFIFYLSFSTLGYPLMPALLKLNNIIQCRTNLVLYGLQ